MLPFCWCGHSWGVGDATDAEVWMRVLGGHPDDFGLVWDRHRDRVFGHLLRAGHDRTVAEDLTAVVFLELWRRRQSVRIVDDSLAPWLLVTARNVSRNAHRSLRRYRELLEHLPPAEPIADPADAVVSGAITADQAAKVERALAGESSTDRELLALTLDGMTVRQAAGSIGLSEAAGKMRLSRLRHRLRAATSDSTTVMGEQ